MHPVHLNILRFQLDKSAFQTYLSLNQLGVFCIVRKIAPTNTKRCARKCLVFLLIVQVALVKGSSALQIQLKRIHSISSSALELLQTPRSASKTKSAVSNLLNFLLFRWVSGERLWRVSHCSRAWRPSLSAPHDLSTEP